MGPPPLARLPVQGDPMPVDSDMLPKFLKQEWKVAPPRVTALPASTLTQPTYAPDVAPRYLVNSTPHQVPQVPPAVGAAENIDYPLLPPQLPNPAAVSPFQQPPSQVEGIADRLWQ